MSNITFLQAVNRVLVRLRESSVSTVSGASDYATLVAAFVNEAKEEVEAAWSWNCENTSQTLTMVAATHTYSLSSFDDEFSIQLVFNTTKNFYLRGPVTAAELVAASYLATGSANAASVWGLYGKDSSGYHQIRFYPTPTDADSITVLGKSRGSYLTLDADVIKVPWRPVVLGASLKAMSERGEDGGAPWDEANLAYEKALSDAIAHDANLGHTNKDWYVD